MNAQGATKRLLYCFLACCTFLSTLRGQEPFWVSEHLGKVDGLLDDRHNTFIKKDSRGFVWISSEQGLFRFDGQQIRPFSIHSSDGINYGEIVQSEIWEDQYDDIWFTTVFALHRFDRDQEQFQSWQFSQESVQIEKDYHAFHLEEERNQLWLLTDQYMWRCDLASMRPSSPFLATQGIRFATSTTANGQVDRMIACPWWIEAGIEIWEDRGADDWQVSYPSDPILSQSKVASAVLVADTAWLATMNHGLLAYDIEEDKVVGQFIPPAYQQFSLWNVQQFTADVLVLAARDEGLWFFDRTKKVFLQNWRTASAERGLLTTNNPIAIHVDSSEHLWVTHPSQGVDHIYRQRTLFQLPADNSIGKESTILKLLEDQHERIWVLTKERGILVFDLSGKLLHHFKQLSAQESSSGDITQMSIDSTGVIWTIAGSSIYSYAPASHLAPQDWSEISVTGASRLISMYHSQDYKYVIATNGVFELKPTLPSQDLERCVSLDSFQNYQFDYFFGIGNDRLLAPFSNHDLWLLEREEKTIKVLSKYAIAAESYDIFQQRLADPIWIGTDKGLFKLENNQFELVLDHKAFGTHCNVYSIQQDDFDMLWLGTDKGLWKYNLTTGALLRYNKSDGIPDEIFFPAARLKASDGKLWLGTEEGLFFFDPGDVELASALPRAYIENLWVNNKIYVGDTVVGEAKAIQLSYFQNTLEFELRTIGFEQIEQSQIKFRLLGYDDAWSQIRNGNIARFTKLPPGSYTLEVLPISANQLDGPLKRLEVLIPPPYWQTLWFKVSVGLLSMLLVGAIPALYYRRKLLLQRRLLAKQKALNEERNRIYRDLHDDLGGGLSSIIFISEDVLEEEKSPGKREQLQRILSLSQQAVKNMRDLIWALNSDKDFIEELAFKIKSDAIQKLKDHHIDLQFNLVSIHNPNQAISGPTRRQILAILTEALNNITKHAQASQVNIEIASTKETLEIRIMDNGLGFVEKTDKTGGYGLANMRHRAEQIGGKLSLTSQKGMGSEITLIVDL